MEEYLSQIEDILHQLALASSWIEDEDLILLTLNGLPEEYDAFKTAIYAKSDVISMEELCALLCSESIHVENKIKHNHDLTVAYAATKGSSGSSGFETQSSSSQPGSYRGVSS